jgi:GNAT superfamily N-acetyltransferase
MLATSGSLSPICLRRRPATSSSKDAALGSAREPPSLRCLNGTDSRSESFARTLSGAELLIRPARITDERALQELMYSLSDESCYRRFLTHKKAHSHEEMQDLVDLDYKQNMALVACMPGMEEIIGVVRYDVLPATRLADVAFVVRDDWQGKGVGTLLMKRIREAAVARGIPGFQADVLATNKPMLDVFHESGLRVSATLEGSAYHLEMLFPEVSPAVPVGRSGLA